MKEEKSHEIRDLESRLSWIVEWVKLCDTKTSFLLALVGVMLPLVLQSKLLQEDMMIAFKRISFSSDCCSEYIFAILFVCVVMTFGTLLLISCWKFLNVLFAKRTVSLGERIIWRANNTVDNSICKKSLLHFNHISSLSYDDFRANIDAEKIDNLREDLLSQIYINSLRCNEKYSYYNDGVRFLFFSGVLLLISYLLHMILFGV